MALYPFMIFREKAYCFDKVIMNHELIHHRQQLELLIIPFYVIYLLNYLINLLKYLNHYKAYRNIIFEREAYANEENLVYRTNRKWWGFVDYLRSEGEDGVRSEK